MHAHTIDDLLAAARAELGHRPGPADLAELTATGALVVDIRTAEQRNRDGSMPAAVVIERNVLEWRLDPASPQCIPELRDHDQTIVVVCDEGYASTLAAASLRRLGLHRATDLDGGFQAWRAANPANCVA